MNRSTRPDLTVRPSSQPAAPPTEPSNAPLRHRATRRGAKPVFVDRSGRRRRLVVASGVSAGAVVVLALVMLIAGHFGASPLPLPGLPDLVGPAPSQGPASPAPQPNASPSTTSEPSPSSPANDPTQTPSHPGNGNGGGNGGGRPSRS